MYPCTLAGITLESVRAAEWQLLLGPVWEHCDLQRYALIDKSALFSSIRFFCLASRGKTVRRRFSSWHCFSDLGNGQFRLEQELVSLMRLMACKRTQWILVVFGSCFIGASWPQLTGKTSEQGSGDLVVLSRHGLVDKLMLHLWAGRGCALEVPVERWRDSLITTAISNKGSTGCLLGWENIVAGYWWSSADLHYWCFMTATYWEDVGARLWRLGFAVSAWPCWQTHVAPLSGQGSRSGGWSGLPIAHIIRDHFCNSEHSKYGMPIWLRDYCCLFWFVRCGWPF